MLPENTLPLRLSIPRKITYVKRGDSLYNVLMVEVSGFFINVSALQSLLLYFAGPYILFVWGACGFAYSRNIHLPTDDSERRDFHIAALVLAPFSLPFIGIMWLGFIFLRTLLLSMMFGCLLIAFPFCLIIFRSTSILDGPLDIYHKIGKSLLRANMFLLRLTGLFPSRA